MTGENINQTNPPSTPGATSWTGDYDPFARGRFPVGVRTIQALDTVRNRLFPCELWYPAAAQHAGQDLALATQDFFTVPPNSTPRSQLAVRNAAAQPGLYPLILFSHSSGDGRRQSTFLCTHLSSHGYVVAALDHSEVIAPELRRSEGEAVEQKTARVQAWIANRVPDIGERCSTAFSRDVRAIRKNSGHKAHGHLAQSRTRALRGRNRATGGALFQGTGTLVCPWTHALPHGCHIEARVGSSAVLGWGCRS